MWVAEYDCLGRNTSLSFFDLEGKPCVDRRGSSGCECRYDEEGEGHIVSLLATDEMPLAQKL
jgi:hypothetical protein